VVAVGKAQRFGRKKNQKTPRELEGVERDYRRGAKRVEDRRTKRGFEDTEHDPRSIPSD
jgi:hypothetical protein